MINLTERCFRYNLVVLTLLRQRRVLIVSLVAPWLFNWWAYQYRWAKVGTCCFRSQRVTLQTAAPPEAVLCMCGECPSASANAPVALTFNTCSSGGRIWRQVEGLYKGKWRDCMKASRWNVYSMAIVWNVWRPMKGLYKRNWRERQTENVILK